MKLYAILVLATVGVVVAEPPFRRGQQGRQQAEEAPYPASGWKPAGQRLELPDRFQAPSNEYGAPSNEYGPAESDPATTTDAPTTTVVPPPSVSSAKLEQERAEQGVYYIVLPDGRLQRVLYKAQPQEQQQRLRAEEDDAEQQFAQPAPRPQQSRPQNSRPQPRPQLVAAAGSAPAPARANPQQAQQPRKEQEQQRADAAPATFVAELQFMEVPPITGPVYSYSGPLVRVLRDA